MKTGRTIRRALIMTAASIAVAAAAFCASFYTASIIMPGATSAGDIPEMSEVLVSPASGTISSPLAFDSGVPEDFPAPPDPVEIRLAESRLSLTAYRDLLDDTQRAVYDQLRAGFLSMSDDIDIDDLPPKDVAQCFEYVLADDPEIFWVGMSYEYMITPDKSTVVSVQPIYTIKSSELDQKKQELGAALAEILNAVPSSFRTDYDRAYWIYTFVCDTLTYTEENAEHQDLSTVLDTKTTACGGYSKLYQILCRKMGIGCTYLTGLSQVGDTQILHAWNMVDIDGVVCYIDSTWGDKDQKLDTDYAWLGLTLSEISQTHEANVPKILIDDKDPRYELWTIEDSYIGKFDKQKILDRLAKSAQDMDEDITLKFATDEQKAQAKEYLVNGNVANLIYNAVPAPFADPFGGLYQTYPIEGLAAIKIIWRY